MPFKNLSTEELQHRLATCRADIEKLRNYGASWALDCREMQINEDNVFHINNELRRREREANSHNSIFKVGDLIIFNAAGMRKKSLGLVIELRGYGDDPTAIKVQWAIIPKYKPRVHNLHYAEHGYGQHDHFGPVWYQDGDWFETFKKK